MSRKNIRLYLRALNNVFQSLKPSNILNCQRFGGFTFLTPDKQLYDGVIPNAPPVKLVKDLNQIDLRCYSYHSSKNLLRKGKVM